MRIRFLLLSCLAWGTAARVQAQAAAPKASPGTRVAGAVDSNSIRAHLEFLADDALEGRRPGTRVPVAWILPVPAWSRWG